MIGKTVLVLAIIASVSSAPQFRLTAAEYDALKLALQGAVPSAIISADQLLSVVDDDPNNLVVVNFAGSQQSRSQASTSAVPEISSPQTNPFSSTAGTTPQLTTGSIASSTSTTSAPADVLPDDLTLSELNQILTENLQDGFATRSNSVPISDATTVSTTETPISSSVLSTTPSLSTSPSASTSTTGAITSQSTTSGSTTTTAAITSPSASSTTTGAFTSPSASTSGSILTTQPEGGVGIPLPGLGDNSPILSQIGNTEVLLSNNGGGVAISDVTAPGLETNQNEINDINLFNSLISGV